MSLEYHLHLARRWLPIALVLALGAGVATAALTRYAVRSSYTAVVVVQVQSISSNDPQSDVMFAQTEAAVANQGAYITQTARLAQRYDPAEAQAISPRQVSCTANGVTTLISCAVTAGYPGFAALVANQLAQVFLAGEQRFEQARYRFRVVTPATAPTAPSSPHPSLNALLAFSLVLVLVYGWAVVADRWALRQRLRVIASRQELAASQLESEAEG